MEENHEEASGKLLESKDHSDSAQHQQVTDDDLDALLDDALQDFKKIPDSPPETIESNSHNSNKDVKLETNPDSDPLFEALWNDDSFLKMTEGMNDVLQQLATEDPSMMAEFEKFKSAAESGGPSDVPVNGNIDENVQKTIDELEKNLKGLNTDEASGGMEDMLKQMQNELNQDGNGDAFFGMMQGMMTNLLSKDLLYPSLKEIRDHYPAWLSENQSKLPSEEYIKYTKQEAVVKRLCEIFEEEKDTDSEQIKKIRMDNIMKYMQEMQEYGHPPADMLSDINGGTGDQATPPMPECCIM